jgi:hypothetical protein
MSLPPIRRIVTHNIHPFHLQSLFELGFGSGVPIPWFALASYQNEAFSHGRDQGGSKLLPIRHTIRL